MTQVDKLPSDSSVSSLEILKKFDARRSTWSLANGLNCIHVPMPPGDVRLHLELMIKTGSRWETNLNSGLAHLLEHMMFRGCAMYPNFSKLSEAFESLGGEWNAATGHEYTEYYYSGTTQKIHDAFQLLSNFIFQPALTDLSTEKRIVLRELEGELNENGVSTDIDYHVLRTLWPNSSIAQPIVGNEDTIAAISREHLIQWLNDHYFAKNMSLVCIGGELGEARRLSEAYFKDVKPESMSKREIQHLGQFRGPKLDVIDNSDNEYDVQITFVCGPTNDPRSATYDMICRILGDGFSSRLLRRIREELGIVYDLSCNFYQYEDAGTFNINTNLSDTNIELFFSEFSKIIHTLISSPLDEVEIQRHRDRAIIDLMLATSDPAHLSFRIGWAHLTVGNPSLTYWASEIEKVTPQKIMQIAGELFDPKNLAIVALGPKTNDVQEFFAKGLKSYLRYFL